MEKPLLLYVVYGPDEKEYFDRLNAHLAVSFRNCEIVVWERSKFVPGQEEQSEIRSKLEQADIALLLITADALASETSYREMLLTISLLERRHKPVSYLIMRSVSYQQSFLDHIPPLLQDNFPKGINKSCSIPMS